ncbi:SH3 domain-containing protein [Peribacillus asahii]|uniref:SH3 domain-containing protein n=1 Tax=Peribacillus asahii TaxID=228899 RepID=UPI0037FADB3A
MNKSTLMKWFVAATLLISIYPIATPTKAAETSTAVVNTNSSNLNVREKASTTSPRVGSLQKGAKVTVYSNTTSGWSQILHNKKRAYVLTKYLEFNQTSTTKLSTTSIKKSTQTGTVTGSSLNIRTGAGTNYKIIGSLKRGTKVTVYSTTKNGWSEIKYQNKKAYVATQYLKMNSQTNSLLLKDYKGDWFEYNHVDGLKTGNLGVIIQSVSQDTATVSIEYYSKNYVYINDTNEQRVTFKNNSASFNYIENDLGIKGKATITLSNNNVILNITNTNSESGLPSGKFVLKHHE